MNDTSETGYMQLFGPLFGPLLKNEEVAEAFATIILKRLYGAAKLAQQQPLRSTDLGEDWLVSGSSPDPNGLPETGPWFIRVRKTDCLVKSFGHQRLEIGDQS
ncbi:NTF2 fold immunity protein [Caulobacter sp. S45]|uniref:NTF2 fold immunity protein n=1 Tax=Caulobacter sp. S45 TaxID=1641861 RepID=UPI00131B1D94|nr:NTF2 fold immunity protein [Caulobacter sp. S45]